MSKEQIYAFVRAAFIEGWNSFETPCCAFNDAESAWECSEAKAAADAMMARRKE